MKDITTKHTNDDLLNKKSKGSEYSESIELKRIFAIVEKVKIFNSKEKSSKNNKDIIRFKKECNTNFNNVRLWKTEC
jgi:hypothetical protein